MVWKLICDQCGKDKEGADVWVKVLGIGSAIRHYCKGCRKEVLKYFEEMKITNKLGKNEK